MSTTPVYNEMLARIIGAQKSAADNEALNMKDPREQGTVTPPNHPDGDNDSKKQVPPSAVNTDGQEGKNLTDKDTHPSSTGHNVPGHVTDGMAKEYAATSSTTDLSKIAGEVQNVMNRITELRKPKQAATVTNGKYATDNANENTANNIQLTPEFHMKLASLILSTEEGVAHAETILRKSAGQEKAQELIQAALENHQGYITMAEEQEYFEKLAYEQQRQQIEAYEQVMSQATPEEVAQIEKYASVHGAYASTLYTPYEKQAYAAGAMDAAGMEESAEALPPEDIEAGAVPEIPGGGEGPMGVEEILALLEEMVASGEIQEEEAMQVAEALLSGEGGGEEMPLPEEAPMEAKAASALFNKLASEKAAAARA